MKEEVNIQNTETFRDNLATVDSTGKRIWMYPKKPKGKFYNARIISAWLYLIIFLTLPFIKLHDEPLFMLNVIEHKFIIFGLVFTPHDFYLFFLLMLTFIVFIILFTVVFGRLFCGWACPQTVFLEMIFRRIEYWIEGDANEQKKLNQRDWDADKLRKRVLKHAIFLIISVVIANYFLAYIIGMDAVLKIMSEPLNIHFMGFIAMVVFSLVFYGVFASLREQVCTTICPYGRLQGVLLVPDSIVIAYDYIRGEPRGKMQRSKDKEQMANSKGQNSKCKSSCANCATCKTVSSLNDIGVEKGHSVSLQGDCIDCKLCVQVCPTGIDIRNGTQLECVNCTACIDACDEVMIKINRPTGLIRYDSATGIKNNNRQIFTTRVAAYSFVLVALLGIDFGLLISRSDIEATILRSPGQMYQLIDSTHLSNLYTYQFINKTHKELKLELKLKDNAGKIRFVNTGELTLGSEKLIEGVFFIDLETNQIQRLNTKLYLEVWSTGKKLQTVKTNFVGPQLYDRSNE